MLCLLRRVCRCSAPGSCEHHFFLWCWCLHVCVCWFAFLLLAVRAELPKKNRQSFLADLSGQLACQGRPFHHYFDTRLLHFWEHFATILEHLGVILAPGGLWSTLCNTSCQKVAKGGGLCRSGHPFGRPFRRIFDTGAVFLESVFSPDFGEASGTRK